MAGRLDGKAAFVLGGGASGAGDSIGTATAITFAREGARVLVFDKSAEEADRVAGLIAGEGGAAVGWGGDATEPDALSEAVAACVDRFGGIDVLHNNVGVMAFGGPETLPLEEWDRISLVNGRSHFLACKYALPHMVAAGRGAIVNVSSIAAIRWTGAPYLAYNASKAAVIGFTRSLAIQYAPQGVRVNCVVPGFIDSPMMRGGLSQRFGADAVDGLVRERAEKLPLRRFGTPWDIANACAFLASDDAAYITGASLVVDGGVTVSCAY